ncbi:MAG TPA: acetate--CoA ligase family protein [Desulfatiglandales bacterium]|nr:acetate--CoA ligase family protein [Desulfatiglandales bacterium]
MLTDEIKDILSASCELGWVLEPEAKRLFSLAGLDVPKFMWATEIEEAVRFAQEIGYPVVAKVVSPRVLHKSDVGGVVVGIGSDEKLSESFGRFSRLEGFAGMLVEEMVSGVELIVGAKVDYQFGPVILLGMGGIGVEIYRDTTLRMAPLKEKDVESMLRDLKAHQLLEGYRGSEPVNLTELKGMVVTFSALVMEIEGSIESIDLNPVLCSSRRCVVADARIILKENKPVPEPNAT